MYLCSGCGEQFTKKQSLTDHESRKHPVSNGQKTAKARYICCAKSFISKSHLQRHRCHVHKETKTYICSTCGKGFAIQSDLNRHKRREQQNLKFKCDECGFTSETQGGLRDHMGKHTREKKTRV